MTLSSNRCKGRNRKDKSPKNTWPAKCGLASDWKSSSWRVSRLNVNLWQHLSNLMVVDLIVTVTCDNGSGKTHGRGQTKSTHMILMEHRRVSPPSEHTHISLRYSSIHCAKSSRSGHHFWPWQVIGPARTCSRPLRWESCSRNSKDTAWRDL